MFHARVFLPSSLSALPVAQKAINLPFCLETGGSKQDHVAIRGPGETSWRPHLKNRLHKYGVNPPCSAAQGHQSLPIRIQPHLRFSQPHQCMAGTIIPGGVPIKAGSLDASGRVPCGNTAKNPSWSAFTSHPVSDRACTTFPTPP